MEYQDHPLARKIKDEVDEQNRKLEVERQEHLLETQRLRAQQGQYLASQFKQVLDDYEKVRQQYLEMVGSVWVAANNYSRTTGVYPSTFPEAIFTDIHAPSLGPNAYNFSPGITTTRASIMAWYNCQGKEWK